jgi:RNA-binding protein
MQFNMLSARANLWHFVAMLTPTSPRKRSLMPSTPLRRTLRGTGHALSPVVQIGKQGVTPPVVTQVTRALLDHELIKIKLGTECPESRFEVAERLSTEPGVNIVQILGRTILLYKRHPKQPKFEKADKTEQSDRSEGSTKRTRPAKGKKAKGAGRLSKRP